MIDEELQADLNELHAELEHLDSDLGVELGEGFDEEPGTRLEVFPPKELSDVDEELEAEIDEAVEDVLRAKREAAEALVDAEDMFRGTKPHRMFEGIGAAWNFTLGPAYVYQGPSSIDEINFLPMPVVVIADYIPEEDLKKIEATRVYGFVFQRSSIVDPTFWWLQDENRAAVVSCPGVVDGIQHGEDVVVDGVRGCVYADPDLHTRENYERLRTLGPPQKDQLLWDALRNLTVVLIGNRKARKLEPPFDFPEQERLLDIAGRARRGETITEDDNNWMQDLVLAGMPSLEEIAEKHTPTLEHALAVSGGAGTEESDAAQDTKQRRKGGAGTEPKGQDASTGKGSASADSKKDKGDAKSDSTEGLSGAAARRAQRKAKRKKE
ncbi:hypothetical protein ACFL59_05180 [Planctomycetota bacterium]